MRRVSRDTNEVSQKVEAVAFDLKLPEEINLDPKWVVDLPRNKAAMIYEVRPPAEKGGVQTGIRYDAYVVSKKTLSSAKVPDNYYNRAQQFNDIPSLKHWLYDIAKSMSVKRRTQKVVAVEDIHDEDDD